MKNSIKLLALALAALVCVMFSGCFNPHEGKVNEYIKENTAFSTQIANVKAVYGDAVDIKTFGRGSDLVIEINVKGSVPDNGETDYTALEEMLKPYLPGLREKSEDSHSNIVYIVKDKDGKEITNKTIS